VSDEEGCFVAKEKPYMEPENLTSAVKNTDPPGQPMPMPDLFLITSTCRSHGSEVPKGTRITPLSGMICLGLEHDSLQASMKCQDALPLVMSTLDATRTNDNQNHNKM
jgi:hypothetical protein